MGQSDPQAVTLTARPLQVLVGDEARVAPPPVRLDPQLYRELLAVADPDGQALLQRWTVTSRDGGTRIKDPKCVAVKTSRAK